MKKHVCLLTFLICLNTSLLACSCYNIKSVCNRINEIGFQENGLIWTGDFTGNVVEFTNYGSYYSGYNDSIPLYSAHEVKVNEILFGSINQQNTSIQNTDTTVWIVLGPSATCYKSRFGIDTSITYLMISQPESHLEMPLFDNSYSFYLCTPDLIPYEEELTAAFYQDQQAIGTPADPLNGETISATELPQLIERCMALPCANPPREGYFNCE